MWTKSFIIILGVVQSISAQDPTAPPTPCVASRVVLTPIQSDINQACQYPIGTLAQTLSACNDYLAQEIVTATQYFCNNQTEAFDTCNSEPGVQPGDCAPFDPTGGSGGEPCGQYVLTVYEYCGSANGQGYFSPPDPVGLALCLYYQLGLCTPDDGTGHYDTISFQGQESDCPIPAYVPACGIFPTSSVVASTTAAPSSPPSTMKAAASTTSPGSIMAIVPTTPPNATYFRLIVNGNFSLYVDPDGLLVMDPTSAEIYAIADEQLFAASGGQVQASQGATTNTSEPYKVFASSPDEEAFQTAFSFDQQDVDRKRQEAVSLTVLLWINDVFATPTTSARFCLYEEQVYAVLQSGEQGVDLSELCETVTLSAVYVTPEQCNCTISTPSSAAPITTTIMATTIGNDTFVGPTACPVGQTLMAFTTVVI